MKQGLTIRHSPRCYGIVSMRWFIRYSYYGHWLFGIIRFHRRWPFILVLLASYIVVTVYYVM